MKNKVKFISEFKGGSMAQTFLIEKNNVQKVRKIASCANSLGAEKLIKQWEWLFNFNEETPGIFPEVGFFVLDKRHGYYDMEFIDMPTVRDTIVAGSTVGKDVINEILYLSSLIATPIDITLYDNNSYIIEKHLNKMIERTTCIETSPFYKSDTVIINGKELKNLRQLIEEIKNDEKLLELLRPKHWHRSHGDLTFQNILMNDEETVVIDPRGEGPDSIYYDLSKLFQSCHGKYDLLYSGNYTVWTEDPTKNIINYNIISGEETMDNIFNMLKELIPNHFKLEQHWELITKFYEASHFISMVPFRLVENVGITMVCYAKGIEILNEVLNEWHEIKKTVGNLQNN